MVSAVPLVLALMVDLEDDPDWSITDEIEDDDNDWSVSVLLHVLKLCGNLDGDMSSSSDSQCERSDVRID